MSKQRRFLRLSILSSLVLAALLLAACAADMPAEVAPTESASETDVVGAEDGAEAGIEELFGETAVSPETTSSETTITDSSPDAAPADTEVDANGVPIGFTENGNPYRGNLNAPVVIEEFSDFQ